MCMGYHHHYIDWYDVWVILIVSNVGPTMTLDKPTYGVRDSPDIAWYSTILVKIFTHSLLSPRQMARVVKYLQYYGLHWTVPPG